MKALIIKSMQSARKKMDPNNRKFCFELFGYDFILDEDFNMFLIEVNTNPCLEESSNILKMYLPRMVEDMLKITVDNVFPKLRKKVRAPVKVEKTRPKSTDLPLIVEEEEQAPDEEEISQSPEIQ